MKALVYLLGRRRPRLLCGLAAALLTLALASPALAAESHVEKSCDTGPVGSETSETGDAVLGFQSASARNLRLTANAAALSTDGPPNRFCEALSRFSNTVSVDPGTSGLSVGAPVTLELSVMMNGTHSAVQTTSDQDFIASALRNASVRATVPDRVVCEQDDGAEVCGPAELATFASEDLFKVEGSNPVPPFPGTASDHLTWGWRLAGNRDPEIGDSGTRSLQTCPWPDEFPCLVVDQPPPDPVYSGTRTVIVDALVGDRIELVGTLDVVAQAMWGSATIDGSGPGMVLRTTLDVAHGFEGVRLVYDLAPPADDPPADDPPPDDPPADDPPAGDTEPPTLTLPTAITVDATGPTGAVVAYTATAADNVAQGLTVSCSPASGATFAVGTTTVGCTATDAAGNATTASFAVTVVGAAGQIVELIDKTLRFLDRPGLSAALRATLRTSSDSAIAGRKTVACTGLRLYMLAVQAAGNAFTSAERSELLADARRIRAVIAC
jgi:hypothetical protein